MLLHIGITAVLARRFAFSPTLTASKFVVLAYYYLVSRLMISCNFGHHHSRAIR